MKVPQIEIKTWSSLVSAKKKCPDGSLSKAADYRSSMSGGKSVCKWIRFLEYWR